MKKLTLLFLALSLLGASCSTQPNLVNFDNNQDQEPQSELRSLDEAKEEGRLVNDVFLYSIMVPEGIDEPLSMDYLKETNESNSLRFTETISKEKANIEVQDPESVTLQHLKDQMTQPLVDFANTIWLLNTEDNRLNTETKEVSSIEKTTFAGKTAYQFTATENFKTTRGERHFNTKYVFIFVEHNGLNYILSYPQDNDLLKTMINSLEFHPKN